MTVQEIAERATINFPTPLNKLEAEDLLWKIALNLPAQIDYNISSFNTLQTYEGNKKIEGTLSIMGNIHNTKKHVFDYFSTHPDREDTSKIAGISFSLIPGYDFSDYRPGVVELWDDVRKEIEEYYKP